MENMNVWVAALVMTSSLVSFHFIFIFVATSFHFAYCQHIVAEWNNRTQYSHKPGQWRTAHAHSHTQDILIDNDANFQKLLPTTVRMCVTLAKVLFYIEFSRWTAAGIVRHIVHAIAYYRNSCRAGLRHSILNTHYPFAVSKFPEQIWIYVFVVLLFLFLFLFSSSVQS